MVEAARKDGGDRKFIHRSRWLDSHRLWYSYKFLCEEILSGTVELY
jgi:hypothetical protein